MLGAQSCSWDLRTYRSLLHTGQKPTGADPAGNLEDSTFEGFGTLAKKISKQTVFCFCYCFEWKC